MIFDRFRRRPNLRKTSEKLYSTLVERARRPDFYLNYKVPDTVDGRFDMISLHAFLVLRRLKQERGRAAELAQTLFDIMFADMDQNLRQLGVGDLRVGKRVKAMAAAFYGRVAAYDAGLAGDDRELCAALRRNLFRASDSGDEEVLALARYVRRQATALDACDLDSLMAGELSFAPLDDDGNGVQSPPPGEQGT
jgi:cytochrome b pre-mRNA-processing protein 3